MTKKIICLFLFLSVISLHAQKWKGQPNISTDLRDSGLTLDDQQKLFTNHLNFSDHYSFTKIATDQNEIQFEQKFNGVPVEFSNYTVKIQNGKLVSGTGHLFEFKPTMNTTPLRPEMCA